HGIWISHGGMNRRQNDGVIGADASALVHLARVTSLQYDVLLRAHHEERCAESEHVQPAEIDVAAIHDIECTSLRHDLVEHVDVMHLAICNADKRWDIAAQIQQRVQFDSGLVLTEPCPREQREAEIDGGGVQRIQARVQIDADPIVDIQWPGDRDQGLRKISEDSPVARLVGIGQSSTRPLAAKSPVVKLAAYGPQTSLNIAQAFAVGELSKAHRQKLV